ncbi:MAG: S8 family serine peptidase, partial [Woeseiaceae bacterium]|nr:S8 family serine peptidase [Woeseiaceae bacterium]
MNSAHTRIASSTLGLLRTAITLVTASLIVACGGGGGGNDPAPIPPRPDVDGGNAPIAGDPDDLLSSAIKTFFAAETVPEEEISIDAHGREVVRTRIQVDFIETATIGQANALLLELGASIHASLEGLPNLVLRIPDPGSLSELDALVAEIRNNPVVFAVLTSHETERRMLPENVRSLIFDGQGAPESDGDWRFVGQHLAVRGAAAWNVAEAASATPAMIFADSLAKGDPADGDPSAGIDAAMVFDVAPLLGTSLGYKNEPLPAKCVNPDLADKEDCDRIVNEREHGYWTLGIATGIHWDAPRNPADLHEHVTGIVPFTVDLLISNDLGEHDELTRDFRLLRDMVAAAAARPGMIVVNRSSGSVCDTATQAGDPCLPVDDIRDRVRSFIRTLRWLPGNLENRVLLVSSVGNRQQDEGAAGQPFIGTHDASTDSTINAAALIPSWPGRFGQDPLPALTNVLSVENATRTPRYDKPTNTQIPSLGTNVSFKGKCTAESSFIGGHIAGIGSGGVFSSIGHDDVEDAQAGDGGTSSATPQVAGLAAYMSAIDPTLTPQRTIDIIQAVATPLPRGTVAEDCSDVDTSKYPRAPLIDAFASVLALDAPGSTHPSTAKVRNALLDVTGPDGDPDTRFDLHDLDALLPKVSLFAGAGLGDLDYGRYDLNGDGYTGGGGGARFDLDVDDVTSSDAFRTAINIDLEETLELPGISFNEKAVTDIQVLCFYAYSDLYVGDTNQRDIRMRPVKEQCACEGTVPSQSANIQKTAAVAQQVAEGQCLAEQPELLITATAIHQLGDDTVGSVDVFKVSGDGSAVTRLTFDADPFRPNSAGQPAWSPSRTQIAFSWNADIFSDIWIMNSDGSGQQQLTFANTTTNFVDHISPEWSPDGQKIAYIRTSRILPLSEIWVMNPDGSDKQLMLSSEVQIFELSWSPDGTKMLYTMGESFRDPTVINLADVVVDTSGGGEAWSLQNPVSFAGAEAINRSPEWSPDG